ncbi:MAG: fibronectin type III domain-containing protein [Oscillospiraceae bacterium]|nr:fibronectin type III domain-containing protein [Oscillospiraceae bacterium]
MDRKWNSKAYAQRGVSSAACLNYYRDFTMVNTPIDQDIYNSESMFIGERAWLNDVTPYEQLKWALAGQLTESDINPPEITQMTFNEALGWKTKDFSGVTYEKAAAAFYEYSMEYMFGDGLPLIPPTAPLVEDMLAGTTRDRNEVLGMMKMRGGVITIEKIAINAVMAGAKPEHMPVLIAAMEAYANGWENDKMWYHNMSTGAYSVGITMIINGPLAKELGIDNGRGFTGSGHEANNLIGRAFRLCIRNIGHNYTPDVDTQNRLGRLNDITLTIFSEAEDELPAGWKPHHVMMGFDPEESTVTMIGTFSNATTYNSEDNTNQWTPQSAMQSTRGHVTTTANLQLFPTGVASVLADQSLAGTYYMPTKEAVKEWWATHTATSGTQARNAGMYNMSYPIVVGGDPNYIASMYGFEGLYATLCFQTQLVSGATITQAGRGATVPSTPQNLKAEFNAAGTAVTLTWDAPLSDGGMSITGYQYNIIHGGNRQTAAWTNVTGGAGARSVTITTYSDNGVNKTVNPSTQFFFKVRAVNGVVNSAEFPTATGALSHRASGLGAWAFADEFKEVEVLEINTPSMVTIARNNSTTITLTVNAGAPVGRLVWAVADPSFATVTAYGDSAVVTAFSKTGVTTLSVTDPVTGLSKTIVLRIS